MARIVDPVCQHELDRKPEDLKLHHEDKTYYFCSEGCKDEFEKNPDKFIRRPVKAGA